MTFKRRARLHPLIAMCYATAMAERLYTVLTSDTSLSGLTAKAAWTEVQKLGIYEIEASIYDENRQPVTFEQLRGVSQQQVSDPA